MNPKFRWLTIGNRSALGYIYTFIRGDICNRGRYGTDSGGDVGYVVVVHLAEQ